MARASLSQPMPADCYRSCPSQLPGWGIAPALAIKHRDAALGSLASTPLHVIVELTADQSQQLLQRISPRLKNGSRPACPCPPHDPILQLSCKQ